MFVQCEEETAEETPIGALTAFSDCLDKKQTSNIQSLDNNLSCITYNLNNGLLELNHYNAGFNCCPEAITADISLNGDTIVISEHEDNALCNCNCLYNLQLEIQNISSGEYHMILNEPYAPIGASAQLDFIFNTVDSASGEFCVERNEYPWGLF